MKVTILPDNANTCPFRMLALAPDDGIIQPLAAQSELAEFARDPFAQQLAIDALVGEVSELDLSDALQEGRYNILLIISHTVLDGKQAGIKLNASYITGSALGRLLAQHQIEICLLMSCASEQFAQDIAAAGVVNVISTQVAIYNETARRFTREFFRELIRVKDVQRSFAYARSRLSAADAATFLLHTQDVVPTAQDVLLTRLTEVEVALQALRQAVITLDKARTKQITNLTNAVLQLAAVITRAE